MTRWECFPTGYFDCCGMAKARGHADLCHRSLFPASTIEARSGKTRSGLIEDESVTPSGGTQETLINQDFANE